MQGYPSDSVRRLLEQQERIRKMIDPPVLSLIHQQQQRIKDILDPPVLRRIRDQQARITSVLDQTALTRIQEQQARIGTLIQSPVLSALREHQQRWEQFLVPSLLAEIANYQVDLVQRVVAASESALTEQEELAWGSGSWRVVLWEIEGLLKALEVITSAMVGSKALLDAPIPEVVLVLLVMLLSAAELALWLAKGSPGES